MPVLLAVAHQTVPPTVRGAAFVATCALLGTLLGWLRLASGSIVPTTIANVVLTFTAGLPLLEQGFEVGLRGAADGPPGWLPMGLAIAMLLVSPRVRNELREESERMNDVGGLPGTSDSL